MNFKEPISRETLLDQLKTSGILQFRGADAQEFKNFTEQFDFKFMDYRGGAYQRKLVGSDKSLMTVNQGSNPISAHGEMYYKKIRPDLIWFYCKEAPTTAGETTVYDGKKIYENLSENTRKLFSRHQLCYERSFSAEAWPKIFGTKRRWLIKLFSRKEGLQVTFDRDGRLISRFYGSALRDINNGQAFINNMLVFAFDAPKLPQRLQEMCTSKVYLDDGSEIPICVLEECREATMQAKGLIKWQAGDFCVIDNRSIMHGRNAVDSTGPREIHTRLATL